MALCTLSPVHRHRGEGGGEGREEQDEEEKDDDDDDAEEQEVAAVVVVAEEQKKEEGKGRVETRARGGGGVQDIVREMGVHRGVNFGAKMCSGECNLFIPLLLSRRRRCCEGGCQSERTEDALESQKKRERERRWNRYLHVWVNKLGTFNLKTLVCPIFVSSYDSGGNVE